MQAPIEAYLMNVLKSIFRLDSKTMALSKAYLKIKPEAGDIVIINPIHYHAISKIKGKHDRISIGFFFAPTDEQRLACWA